MTDEKLDGTKRNEGTLEVVKQQKAMELTTEDVERLARSMEAFNKLKNDILRENVDKVVIKGKEAITRSGYSKISLAFNISTEVRETKRERTPDDYIVHVTVRAYTPSGRFADGQGMCSRKELALTGGGINITDSNVEQKASTKARSRAIADISGGSIVSAEELDAEFVTEDEKSQQKKTFDREIGPGPMTEKQRNRIEQDVANKRVPDLNEIIKKEFGSDATLSSLTKVQASTLIDILKAYTSRTQEGSK